MMMGLVVAMGMLAALSPDKMLVSAEDLSSLENVLLVDVRAKSSFEEGHIKGAVNVDMSALQTLPGMSVVQSARTALETAGVDPSRHVVIYSSAATVGDILLATRLFWAMDYMGFEKVSILNGGYEKWVFDRHPTDKGPMQAASASLTSLTPKTDRLAPVRHVYETVKEGSGIIADVRDAQLFTGAAIDPVLAATRQGHIPRAKNVPADQIITGAFNMFRTANELQNVLLERGVESNTQVIAVGSTGLNASLGYFVLRLTGRDSSTLFDGSMQEWSGASDLPVESSIPSP